MEHRERESCPANSKRRKKVRHTLHAMLRYTDPRKDEQQRGMSIKACPIPQLDPDDEMPVTQIMNAFPHTTPPIVWKDDTLQHLLEIFVRTSQHLSFVQDVATNRHSKTIALNSRPLPKHDRSHGRPKDSPRHGTADGRATGDRDGDDDAMDNTYDAMEDVIERVLRTTTGSAC